MQKRKGRPENSLVRTTVALPPKTLDDIELLKQTLHASRNDVMRQAIDVLRFVVVTMEEGDHLTVVSKDGTGQTRIVLPGLTR